MIKTDSIDWRCECGDLNRGHEAPCYRCGAGRPGDVVPVGDQCGEARRDLPLDYVCREGRGTIYVAAC